LQNAWNKYGEKSFKFQLIEEVPVEQLLDIEQKYLDIVKETPQLYYNTAMCATAPMRGLTHSDETKAKMSESRSGCNNVNWGKELSDEHKEKLSQSHKGQVSGNKGKKASKETILKLKLSHIGQIPAMSGKCHSEESKRKMSESSKRLWTDEYRKRMSDAHKGKRKNI
jgi:group I intron endonuclease